MLRILLVHHSIREFQTKSGRVITDVHIFMYRVSVTSSTSFLILLCHQLWVFLFLQELNLVLMRVHSQPFFQFPSLNLFSQNVSDLFLSLLIFSVSTACCVAAHFRRSVPATCIIEAVLNYSPVSFITCRFLILQYLVKIQ